MDRRLASAHSKYDRRAQREGFIRDAQGNVLSTYRHTTEQGTLDGASVTLATYKQTERHIYGSSRLGMETSEVELIATDNLSPLADAQPYTTNADDRVYELSNHLGNVLATFTARKLPLTEADVVVGFAPHVTSLSDYYPFGSSMKGRSVDGGYRYGFNGMENDEEFKGQGNSIDFGARVYDSRLGRWLSKDPLEKQFPGISTYSFSYNSPTVFKDPDGKNGKLTIDYENRTVTLESTIFLYSADPSLDLSAMASAANELLNGAVNSYEVQDPNDPSKIWLVKIDVKVVFDQQVNDTAIALGLGDMTSGNISNGDVGIAAEDNLINVNPALNFSFGNGMKAKGFALIGGNLGSSNGEYPNNILHEGGHLLGFDERYHPSGLPYTALSSDFMSNGSQTSEYMAFHFVDVLDKAIDRSSGVSGSYITRHSDTKAVSSMSRENGMNVVRSTVKPDNTYDNTNGGLNVNDVESKTTRVVSP